MISNLVSMFSNAFVNKQTAITPTTQKKPSNPFENPFMNNTSTTYQNNFYGKNAPVRGGYFAGYYNGVPNIVGKRLFLEV